MADIILPGQILPLKSSTEPDIIDLTDDDRLALGKQQRLTDVLETGKLELEADRRFGESFDLLEKGGGLSAPDFIARSDEAADRITQELLESLPKGVSDGARQSFVENMARRREEFDLDVDGLRGVTRTRDGLALVEDFVSRAAEIVNREPFRLKTRLDEFDRVTGDMGTALVPLREDALRERRATIVISAIKGMVALGQGEKAKPLLQSGVLDGRLKQDALARMIEMTGALTQAFEADQSDRDHQRSIDAARKRQADALAFTANTRDRIGTGQANQAEIATAESEGVLTTAQADRLREDMADAEDRRQKITAKVDRVTSMLDEGRPPNPDNADGRGDVAHHYDSTFKPSLSDLDPAQKAAAIGGYVTEIGIVPYTALNTLLGLTATGEPANRIAAARELTDVFTADPTARNRAPSALADYAKTIVQLADLDAIPPEDIIETAEIYFGGDGTATDQPSRALLHLASAEDRLIIPTDSQPDSRPVGKSQHDVTTPDNGIKGVIPNLSPFKGIVDIEQLNKKFQFEANGPSEFREALRSPAAGLYARTTATESIARAKELFDTKTLSFKEANAFQHAIWSFKLTQNFGPEIAKKLGDAHERSVRNKDSDRLKDLFNNNAGRDLATDPANRNRPAEEVVLEAIRAGKLQIEPVQVPPLPAGILRVPARQSPF